MQSTDKNLVLEDALRNFPEARSGRMSSIGSIALALCMLAVLGLGVERLTGVVGLFPGEETDQVSDQQAGERGRAFSALESIELRRVGPAELDAAVASMKLPPLERDRFLEQIMPSHVVSSELGMGPPQASVAPPAVREASTTLRLAWITLWDTDAMDSDTVRFDSEGYSRTITLSKSPTTFAVPIPQSGVMNITGMRDGGGGITVGVMSGVRPVSLPIMSEGQVIGIPATIP